MDGSVIRSSIELQNNESLVISSSAIRSGNDLCLSQNRFHKRTGCLVSF